MPASADATLAGEIFKLEEEGRDEELKRILPRSHSFEAGDLIEVRLVLTVTSEGHYIALNDPLPAGLEIVDPSLKGAVADQLNRSSASRWSGFNHVELRDDRVLLFADRLRPGTYRFSYLARATQAGRFIRPAAIASEMYQPERAGQSDGGLIWIKPREMR